MEKGPLKKASSNDIFIRHHQRNHSMTSCNDIMSTSSQVGSKLLKEGKQLIDTLQKRVASCPSYGWITEKTFLRTFSEDSLHTCSPSNFWSAFLSLKWIQTALLWPILKDYPWSINRGGHWRFKARVWNTKALISQKQSISQSFSQSSSSHKHNSIISHYIFSIIISWVCICKSLMCWDITIKTTPIIIQSVT